MRPVNHHQYEHYACPHHPVIGLNWTVIPVDYGLGTSRFKYSDAIMSVEPESTILVQYLSSYCVQSIEKDQRVIVTLELQIVVKMLFYKLFNFVEF